MSDHERYGQRDMLFSRWHRSLDKTYKFLDIDWIEFCHVCSEPLAFIEIAQDVGQDWKPTTVLERAAKRANVPAFCILYQVERGRSIVGARVRRVFPDPTNFKQRNVSQLERLIARIHSRCKRHDGERHAAAEALPKAVAKSLQTVPDEELTAEYWMDKIGEDIA